MILARNEGTGSASRLAAEPARPTECDGSLDDSMLVALGAATGSERREQLINLIRREFAVVLGVADPEMLDRRSRLIDLGIDSLMAIQVRARLGRALRQDRPLPATLVFDHPTIEALSRFLETEILGFKEAPVVPAEASPLAQQVADMSEAEAEALLLERIESSRIIS